MRGFPRFPLDSVVASIAACWNLFYFRKTPLIIDYKVKFLPEMQAGYHGAAAWTAVGILLSGLCRPFVVDRDDPGRDTVAGKAREALQ